MIVIDEIAVEIVTVGFLIVIGFFTCELHSFIYVIVLVKRRGCLKSQKLLSRLADGKIPPTPPATSSTVREAEICTGWRTALPRVKILNPVMRETA